MPTMLSEVYDALKEAGASEEKARAAAAAVVAYENHLAAIEAKLTMLQWIIGLGFGLIVILLLFIGGLLWQVLQRLPTA